MSLKLYFAAGSSTLPALIALEETGAPFEAVRLSLADGDQRRPAFLAIHPRGRAPVLVIDGVAVAENVAVLSAIAHQFPDARLLPFDDRVQLAKAYELIGWFASGVHVAFAQVFRPERFTADETIWPALKAGGREKVLEAYAEIEARAAASGPWLLGERYSLVDPYAVVFWRWRERLDIAAAYPAFADLAARVLDRPAARRALARETAPQSSLALA